MSITRDRFSWLLLSLILISAPVVAQDDESFAELDLPMGPGNAGLKFLDEGDGPNNVEQLQAMQDVFVDLAKGVAPATVNIAVGQAQGSGVVVSRDGYILTAAHVITRPNLDATITFADGSRAKAITLGVNSALDSGMLKITDKGKWPFLDIGESGNLVRGQWVMAIGHPGGLTKGRGLVFRTGRILASGPVTLTTDDTLVGGDSGGPLVDLDGYVIGIHSRIGSELTENFHVPIDLYSNEWDQLTDGVVVGSSKAYLGISFTSNSSLKIRTINKNEGAGKAGMKVNDIIIKVNDKEVKTRAQFNRALRKLKPRDVATFTVRRGEEEINLEVTLGYGHRQR